jgi:hypothetical protein
LDKKYKIFLIYFSGKKWQSRAVRICTVSDTLRRQSSARRRPDLPGTACAAACAV